MKHTKNLNLNKPEATDYVNIEDLNENADIIDEEVHDTKQELENLESEFMSHKAEDATDAHKIKNISGLQSALNDKENILSTEQKRTIYVQETEPTSPSENDIWIEIEV